MKKWSWWILFISVHQYFRKSKKQIIIISLKEFDNEIFSFDRNDCKRFCHIHHRCWHWKSIQFDSSNYWRESCSVVFQKWSNKSWCWNVFLILFYSKKKNFHLNSNDVHWKTKISCSNQNWWTKQNHEHYFVNIHDEKCEKWKKCEWYHWKCFQLKSLKIFKRMLNFFFVVSM